MILIAYKYFLKHDIDRLHQTSLQSEAVKCLSHIVFNNLVHHRIEWTFCDLRIKSRQ